MDNNTENNQQTIQEIFDKYLAERKKIEPTFITELFDSLAGKPNVSEEFQKLQQQIENSSDAKFSIELYLKGRKRKLEFLSNIHFSLVKSTLLSVFVLFLLRFTLRFKSDNLVIIDSFGSIWLVILFFIVFRARTLRL